MRPPPFVNGSCQFELGSELELRQWDDDVVESEPSSSLRLCSRRRQGFGFVAVEASASSPLRLQLCHRGGFGFVAIKASASLASSASSPLRLLLRQCRLLRGFKVASS
ncbi:hypothetical protein ACLB2K_016742 [Fragaria x ananassa]